VIEFKKSASWHSDQLTRLLEALPNPKEVELAFGAEEAAHALRVALIKASVAARKRAVELEKLSSPQDPFREIKQIIAATSGLHVKSGRLSAKKVARFFDLSVSGLAKLFGKKRQTLLKTDDSESIQTHLTPFERIARLRAVLSDADFRKWLRMPNRQLDKQAPRDLIRKGDAIVVADLVEDMLSGTAT
jgi:uncharacterized protein (DUF2384 family)